jgi:predicted ribosomally synthesized peptide with nif11-like leader
VPQSELLRFLAQVKADPALRQMMADALTADEVSLLAQERGFLVSGSDILRPRSLHTYKPPRLAPGVVVSSHAEVWNGLAKLLTLAPGAMHSRCVADDPPEGTFSGAAGVSISQAHKVSCTGECCSFARLNDPPTFR